LNAGVSGAPFRPPDFGILGTLRNDETLSSYVESVSHGHPGYSRKKFPFVEVGSFHIRPERVMAGSITLLYTVEIIAGTRSLAPGVAYKGSPSGKKGINDLCDDICDAVRGQSFGGMFRPVYRITSDPNYRRDKGESIHIGMVVFNASHWTMLRAERKDRVGTV